jgi:hypothetical protein
MTPSTAPYSNTISPFHSVVDPSLSMDLPKCRWLEDNISLLSRPSKGGPTSTSSGSSYSTPDPLSCTSTSQPETGRSEYETELLSHLPKKELVDELVSIFYSATDVCHTTFKPVFDQSYRKFWETPPDQPINVPFLGLLFTTMANAIQCHPEADGPNAEKAKKAMELYDHLSIQITEDPRYNFHVETVEATLLHSLFVLNEGKMNNAFLKMRGAIAVAHMIGLQRDPKMYRAKPLQAERARRLWWKLYDMDRALSLFMGRPYTIMDKFVDVELPVPYDDSDISEGPDGEMIIDKSRTGKTVMYYRIYQYYPINLN